MAQASGVTCDHCGMFVAVKLSPTTKVTLPVGWYEVFGILESGERTLIAEVCSARCLGKVAKVRGELEKPILTSVIQGRPA